MYKTITGQSKVIYIYMWAQVIDKDIYIHKMIKIYFLVSIPKYTKYTTYTQYATGTHKNTVLTMMKPFLLSQDFSPSALSPCLCS